MIKTKTPIVLLLLFLLSCKSSIQATQTPLTQTQIASSTKTAKLQTATITPALMNTEHLMTVLRDGLKSSSTWYNWDAEAISASYRMNASQAPITLSIKLRDNSTEDHLGCFAPLPIFSYGTLGKNLKSVFPASLENIAVDCYSPSADLLLSYKVTFDNMLYFASTGSIDPERIEVIESNLPTFTPVPTVTARPVKATPTITVQPIKENPTANNRPNKHSPTVDPLKNVTAICMDGTNSYSQHRQGTCSGHGGVKEWVHKPPS